MSTSDEKSSLEISDEPDEEQIVISPEDDVEFQDIKEDKIEIKNQSTFVSQREIIVILFSKKRSAIVIVSGLKTPIFN